MAVRNALSGFGVFGDRLMLMGAGVDLIRKNNKNTILVKRMGKNKYTRVNIGEMCLVARRSCVEGQWVRNRI